MGKGRAPFHAALAVSVAIIAGCEPGSATRPGPESAAAVARLPQQVLADTRINLDDVVERLIPSLGDVSAESQLHIQIAAFQADLAIGDSRGAEGSLASIDRVLTAHSAATGDVESADVGAIRVALYQAASSLTKLKEVQKAEARQ